MFRSIVSSNKVEFVTMRIQYFHFTYLELYQLSTININLSRTLFLAIFENGKREGFCQLQYRFCKKCLRKPIAGEINISIKSWNRH